MAGEEAVRNAWKAGKAGGEQRLRHGFCLAEGHRPGKRRRAYRQHLEQLPHPGRRHQPLYGGLDLARAGWVGRHQPSRALGDAETAKELRLGHGPIGREPGGACFLCER